MNFDRVIEAAVEGGHVSDMCRLAKESDTAYGWSACTLKQALHKFSQAATSPFEQVASTGAWGIMHVCRIPGVLPRRAIMNDVVRILKEWGMGRDLLWRQFLEVVTDLLAVKPLVVVKVCGACMYVHVCSCVCV